jgi:hypothetical protein
MLMASHPRAFEVVRRALESHRSVPMRAKVNNKSANGTQKSNLVPLS